MVLARKYWTLRMIDASGGYQDRLLPLAQGHFKDNFGNFNAEALSTAENKKIQRLLFSEFFNPQHDLQYRATAGLCLRCYISHAIFEACQKMTENFGDRYGFSCVDILPWVLTDDGRQVILWDDASQTQMILDKTGGTQPSSYSLFSVDILRKFNPTRQNLKSWTLLLTRRHRELTQVFEREYGLCLSTDWAVLNQVTSRQMKNLLEYDRIFVEVFHQVYRRDRRQQAAKGKCPDPSEEQLTEMLDLIDQSEITFHLSEKLLYRFEKLRDKLKNIATFLRETKMNPPVTEPPVSEPKPLDPSLEQWLNWRLVDLIGEAINRVIPKQINQLEQSRWYAEFAPKYLLILRLIYCEKKSQREVAHELEFSNQSQVSRVLKLENLIKNVRFQVKDRLLGMILEYQDKAQVRSDANLFETLITDIENYLDNTVFSEAYREIKASKSRKMNSLFAVKIRQYLDN